jgi:hypothetical protein
MAKGGLATVNEEINTRSPMRKFFFTLLAAFGEMEHEQIRQRTSDAIRHHQASGRRMAPRREVLIYSVGLDEVARHPLVSGTVTGVRQTHKSHHPGTDPGQRVLLLKQRFHELGPIAEQFLAGLLAKQVQGKLQAQQVLALLAHYRRVDVLAALERASRFGAFSLAAVRRILAAQAKPKPLLEELADGQREALDPSLRQEPIGPRPTSAYQHLLEVENPDDETPSAENTGAEGGGDAAQPSGPSPR